MVLAEAVASFASIIHFSDVAVSCPKIPVFFSYQTSIRKSLKESHHCIDQSRATRGHKEEFVVVRTQSFQKPLGFTSLSRRPTSSKFVLVQDGDLTNRLDARRANGT